MVGDFRQGRMLRRIALGIAAAYVLLGGMFIVGETFTDPGGWRAVGLTSAWLVPLLFFGWLGLWRPDVARLPLSAITAAVILLDVAAAASGRRWSAFEDHHGPVRAIVVFALCGILAAFGYRRPTAGGVLLLLGAVVSATLGAVTGGPGTAALPVVSAPGVVVGVLYLLSTHGQDLARSEHGARPTRGRQPSGTTRAPVARGRGRFGLLRHVVHRARETSARAPHAIHA